MAKAKAVAKIAQRDKVEARTIPCPTCQAPIRGVLYCPPRGKSVNARLCEKCRVVWNPHNWAMLAENVPIIKVGIA